MASLEPTAIGSGHEGSVRDQITAYVQRLKNGEMGALPAVIALFALVVLFASLSPYFLTTLNFANLFVQAAQLTVLAAALVFVLLLAEIDLSAGVTAGVGMAVFAVLNLMMGINWIIAVIAALLVGTVVGWTIGIFVAKIGVPSFVVTLGLFLGFQGLMLVMLGDGGLYRLDVPELKAIMNGNMPVWAGWLMLAIMVAVSLGLGFYDRARRAKAGVANRPISLMLLRVGTIAVLGGIAVGAMSVNRSVSVVPIEGVPIVIPIVIGILFVGTFVLDRTTFGRHLYAVGGNPEAARRAGIKVAKIRITAFIICSTLAVVSGILAASRIGAIESTAGRSIVLSGVAAAVVGGVSLFGGRGRLIHAAIGALVIAIIDNGLGLIGLPAGVNFLVTGAVLIAAATIDALSRKRSGGGVRV
ncbi:sugar ABC transporter permease [Aurantimicrobium sp. MWH-Uga1]|uniref:sugar ABC transporter permease n=1 Tax=Aurantimicrobium sp. MWH-Uga1 TaxID=2079575 RepID=UPI000DEDC83F|nr:ABC transporter permease [Aurantimicrobium sp. MWH-Uga1]AXE55056.1 Xylose transport system permease protein XylH [Aurantimicrobium sp. MWH-Uga1]